MKVGGPHRTGLAPRAAELVELARESLGHMSARQRAEGLHALRSRFARRLRARSRHWSALAASAALAGAALTGAVVFRNGAPSAISFRVEGTELRTGGYVVADPATRPVLHFSDGSEVTLAEGTRVRVRSTDENGARVTVDEGQAHVDVVHFPRARWSFDAGPFVVAVTGTAFTISWAAEENRLDVRLENGTVTVSGPVSDAPIALRAGQWLTVRASEVLIRGLGAPGGGSNEAPHDQAPSVESGTPSPAERTPESSALESGGRMPGARRPDRVRDAVDPSGAAVRSQRRTANPQHHWAADLADGRFASIVDDALLLGVAEALLETSTDELAALADAARYTRHDDIARGALLAQRRRFPGSEHARVAAFFLGRLAETQRNDREALSWFESYSMEDPNGTYASEALGRKMTLVEQLDGNDAARPLAEAYLRRFPSGTYAQAAHALRLAQ
jgi:hypothetical protein